MSGNGCHPGLHTLKNCCMFIGIQFLLCTHRCMHSVDYCIVTWTCVIACNPCWQPATSKLNYIKAT